MISPEPESTVPEAVWEIEYSEPVPDLYPELSDSLKMQESDTEHDERAKGISLLFYLLSSYFIYNIPHLSQLPVFPLTCLPFVKLTQI